MLQRHPSPYGSTAIETFAEVPGKTFLSKSLLQVASSEIDSNGYFVVVSIRKTFGNASPEMIDAYAKFCLILTSFRIRWNKEWPSVCQQGRVCFREDNRLLSLCRNILYI